MIHTAFIHDFTKWQASCEIDRHAIEAIGSALAGSDRPLIVTFGTGVALTPGRPSNEEDAAPSMSAGIPRLASEEAAAAVVAQGVRAAVVRLPPTVHGDGDDGFVPDIISIARKKAVSAGSTAGLQCIGLMLLIFSGWR